MHTCGVGQEFVERARLDVVTRERRAERLRAPHGDSRERLTIGEVKPAHGEHAVGAERRARRCRGKTEGEVEHSPGGLDARGGQLVLERLQFVERLMDFVAACVPAKTLTAGQQALVAQLLEGTADRDPAGVVSRPEPGFRREKPASSELTRKDASAKCVGDLLVARCPHVLFLRSRGNHGTTDRATLGPA